MPDCRPSGFKTPPESDPPSYRSRESVNIEMADGELIGNEPKHW